MLHAAFCTCNVARSIFHCFCLKILAWIVHDRWRVCGQMTFHKATKQEPPTQSVSAGARSVQNSDFAYYNRRMLFGIHGTRSVPCTASHLASHAETCSGRDVCLLSLLPVPLATPLIPGDARLHVVVCYSQTLQNSLGQ